MLSVKGNKQKERPISYTDDHISRQKPGHCDDLENLGLAGLSLSLNQSRAESVSRSYSLNQAGSDDRTYRPPADDYRLETRKYCFKKLAPVFMVAISLILFLFVNSCGTIIPDIPDVIVTKQRLEEADRLLESDPQGPIARPNIPSYILKESAAYEESDRYEKITYSVEVTAPDHPPDLVESFNKVAKIQVMKDRPLESHLTLMRRLHSSLEQAHDLLCSLGYYEGKAEGRLDEGSTPGSYVARINLIPGPLYHLAPGRLIISNAIALTVGPDADPVVEDIARELAKNFIPPEQEVFCPALPGGNPCPVGDLVAAGLTPGDPAKADDVLVAVDRLVQLWKTDGYPKAEVTASRYSIDTEQKTLEAEIVLTPGKYVKMGQINILGDDSVKPRYMSHLVNWREGQNWNQETVETYRQNLMQTGLFKSVEVSPGLDPDPNGNYPIMVTLEQAPRRTVTGSVNYDSDWGPGVAISWEHRNLTGWADRLRVELPLWKDLAQFGLSYQRPFIFNSRNHSLLAESYLLREKTDNYYLSSASMAVGIERIVNQHLRAQLRGSVEIGTLDEYLTKKNKYKLYGLPLTLNWSNTDSYLNPTKGLKFSLLVSPYVGQYIDSLKVLKVRADFSIYQPLLSEDTLVAAFRLAAGSINGTKAENLPSSLRFFGGGGQSVRGYEYQSIGPKNARGRPAGGSTLAETSAELRYRWSQTMGAVAFIDGGMVYNNHDLYKIGRDFLWGGGLGFRYYSPIGPFRLDLATPLTPRDDDSRIQVYLSLGQSF
ncbi:MAG: BamA/TamA family outer membrane protein [Deltaproteobacteria bacterium]|jgi:translocation and assembly module TamA|nr:BamA/TamA family outer membrane protein [Deltaproteobacteria bacterium]